MLAYTGQQELTLLHLYIKAAKLKYWLTRPSCPPVFREVKSLFDRFVSPLVDANPISVSEDHSPTPQAVLHAHTLHKRSIYTYDSTHVGNSLILYYSGGIRNVQPTLGIIKYIFEMERVVGFAMRHYLPLHSHPDPFHHYPYFLACLYSSMLAEHLKTVKPEWVVMHFARWNVSPQHIVAMSLSSVCPLPFFHMSCLTMN
ncbi:hypothetical protein BDR06DRAFT_869113 [Suillus hirtellus]|nr:hypothetical protein BDR06DRAFT_869113 [Suillus hirtellus]